MEAVLDLSLYFCPHISTRGGNGEEPESVSAPISGVVSSFNISYFSYVVIGSDEPVERSVLLMTLTLTFAGKSSTSV